jgi:hypothetical protein
MIQKSFSDISPADVQQLIDNEVGENLTMDYKRDLPDLNIKDSKREFLWDIASFANSSGGDIIFGLHDKRENGKTTGLPEFFGVVIQNEDELKKKWHSVIGDGIEPRIPGVEMMYVPYDKSGVFIVRIPKSWAAPHMVTSTVRPVFYARNSTGKYPLAVNEIGALFRDEMGLADKMREFRNYRVSQIIANETPVILANGPRIVVHILPMQAFRSSPQTIDFKLLTKGYQYEDIRPIYWHFQSERINFDGLLSYAKSLTDGIVPAFTQIYRDGRVEATESGLLHRVHGRPHQILFSSTEPEMVKTVAGALSIYKKSRIQPPVVVFAALLGVKGMTICPHDRYLGALHAIDRDHLLTPEVVINGFHEDLDQSLKPIFDCIWNACGYHDALSYKDGKRIT